MLPEKLHAYFSFTKKERTGILVLLFLIGFVFILPYFFSFRKTEKNEQAFEQFKNEIAQLKTRPREDSAGQANTRRTKPGQEYNGNYQGPSKQYTAPAKATLFYFDPNTINLPQWEALGLRDKTIQTIRNYIAKGGRFRSPRDLQKIYGLHADDYERLSPFVRIAQPLAASDDKKSITPSFANTSVPKPVYSEIIDVNTADTTAFIALPGIGSKLANRIVNFRERLGGFFTVDQVGETYALPDSAFLRIRRLLKITGTPVMKIDVNTADANTLKQHPYIRWNLANAIVQYRRQHGAFKSLDDLQQIAMVTPEIFQKISHYLQISTD